MYVERRASSTCHAAGPLPRHLVRGERVRVRDEEVHDRPQLRPRRSPRRHRADGGARTRARSREVRACALQVARRRSSPISVATSSRASSASPQLIIAPDLEAALFAWLPQGGASCDRAALLCTQDPEATGRALAKLGGGGPRKRQDTLNLEEVLAQAKDYEKLDDSILLKGMQLYQHWHSSHPYPIYRAKVITEWAVRAMGTPGSSPANTSPTPRPPGSAAVTRRPARAAR